MKQPADTASAKGATSSVETREFLTFDLAGQEYAVPLLRVREIVAGLPITPLAGASGHLLGVVSLRGRMLPVVDMSSLVANTPHQESRNASIVVAECQDTEESDVTRLVGCIVDSVTEIRPFAESAIQNPPEMQSHLPEGSVMGLAERPQDSKVVTILDIDCLMGNSIRKHSPRLSA
ncbi:MAG: chemotaxis protein CheW [Planctomycetota bacterium]